MFRHPLAFLVITLVLSFGIDIRAGQIHYDYAELNRLVSVSYHSDTQAKYVYDPAGNLKEHELIRDSDGDGLPDSWEYAYFGSLTNATTETDADGDGFTDGTELVLGSNPLDAESGLNLVGIQTTATATNFLIRWPGETNRTYRVESTTNMFISFAILAEDLSGTPPVNVHTDSTATAEQTFYRVFLEDSP